MKTAGPGFKPYTMRTTERFSIECRKTKTKTKTKTKAITMTNHNKRKQQNEPMRTQTANTRNLRELQEMHQVATGFGFASDWLSGRHKFFKPITEHSI